MKKIENVLKSRVNENLRINLRLCRKAQSMTQEELSSKSEVAIQTVIEVEAGVGNITIETLLKLAIGLNIHWIFLLSGKEEIAAFYEASKNMDKNKNNILLEDIDISLINYDKIEFKKLKKYCMKIAMEKYKNISGSVTSKLSNLYVAIKLGLELKDIKKMKFSENLGISLSKRIGK